MMRRTAWTVGLAILLAGAVQASARPPLTFEERIAAVQAIERVYHERRIWPEDNPGPKPPFEQMVPRSVIEAKVIDAVKKSNALEVYWGRPIRCTQLQAEMDRLVRSTQDREMLRDLFAALDDDPYLIAECLARPVLADRLARNGYARDTRFHGETKRRALQAMAAADPRNLQAWPEGRYTRETYRFAEDQSGAKRPDSDSSGAIVLGRADFEGMRRRYPAEMSPRLEEENTAFIIHRTAASSDDEIAIERLVFPKEPFDIWWASTVQHLSAELPCGPADHRVYTLGVAADSEPSCEDSWHDGAMVMPGLPDPREWFTAVWTGTEMIIWGGEFGYGYVNTGGRYDPATDTWRATSVGLNCPEPRGYHEAVWTGTEMIVWGGWDRLGYVNTGGRYDPVHDSWMPMSVGDGCPEGRYSHTMIWTGAEMIVWGGRVSGSGNYFDSGGRYDPISDSWAETSQGQGCPSPRSGHSAVWTGMEMIVWGGADDNGSLDTGGYYDPLTDGWRNTPTGPGCPCPGSGHAAVWTGTQMIVWGGDGNSGGRLDPAAESWQPTSQGEGCPSPRSGHSAVWTGDEMIIWGGRSGSYLQSGARYDPLDDSWIPTSEGENCPSARGNHTAVWTGSEMIVWGWKTSTGGRYDPDTDTWLPTSTEANIPQARYGHSLIWTGSEMIVWGGQTGWSTDIGTGGRYDLALDAWTPTAADSNALSRRTDHSAVWTGMEMIIWGGRTYSESTTYLQSGGRYDPVADTWAPTSMVEPCPSGRSTHGAVWTGEEMIIWGSSDRSGGRYDPATDSWAATAVGDHCPYPNWGTPLVWTGSEMIYIGGYEPPLYRMLGGRYDPAADTWQPVSTGSHCPEARHEHTVIWTGREAMVWGGWRESGDDFLGSGGRYDPEEDSWHPIPLDLEKAPKRTAHVALWTGSEMLVWGGYNYQDDSLQSGSRYNPTTDRWTPTDEGLHCPFGRDYAKAVWAGTKMLVWGGYPGTATGGIYSILPTSVELEVFAAPNAGHVPLTVAFEAAAIPQGCAGEVEYSWDFGDGTTSSGTEPNHVFETVGEFTWSVLATVNGIAAERQGTVMVTAPPCDDLACSAVAAPSAGSIPLSVQFSASAEPGYCVAPVSFTWDFGDGFFSQEQDPTHEYAAPGTYEWSMTAEAGGAVCERWGTVNAYCNTPAVVDVRKKPQPFRLKIETAIDLHGNWGVYLAGQTAPWSFIMQKDPRTFVIKKAGSLFPSDGSETVIEIINGDGCATAIAYNRKEKSWRPIP